MIILKMLMGIMMFLPYRWYELSIFEVIHKAYIVKDDLVFHFINRFCWTNHSGYRFILLLVTSKQLKLQKPDCAHLKDFLMKINLPFLKKFLAFLEAEISSVETLSKNCLLHSWFFSHFWKWMFSFFCLPFLNG